MLDAAEGTTLRVWLERLDYPQPLEGEGDPPVVVMLELLWTDDRRAAARAVAVVPPGPALRWARLLRVAGDELTAETRFRDFATDIGPNWRFQVVTASRELQGYSLGVVRYPASRLPLARLHLGFDEVMTGAVGVRDAAAAIEHEVAGLLDSAIL